MGFSGNGYSTASTVITSEGDLRIGNSTGAAERLAIGSSGKVLESNGSTASWETLTTADSTLTTQGDILYEGASALARLGQSTSGFLLTTKGAGANPAWEISPTPTAIQYSVAAMSGVDFDFSSTDLVQTISIDGNTTFTGSNYAAGKSITLFITTDGSQRDLVFPSGWIFQGTKPTTQGASLVGTLTLLCASDTEASVRCAYAVEE